MAADWLKIKSEYVSGNISYRKLAEKYGVSFDTLQDRAKRENWTAEKKERHDSVTTATRQKIIEKTSEALSDEAAAKVRIKAAMMRLAEGWFAQQESYIAEEPNKRGINPSDFRKMVQSCVDLGILAVKTEEEENKGGVVMIPEVNESF